MICLGTLSRVVLLSAGNHMINSLHKFHDEPVSYPTMHHFVTEMLQVCIFLLYIKWCIAGYLSNAL